MPPECTLDPSELDCERVVADQEGIRRVNPQRFEMEQLTAIVHVDREQHLIIGYKDVTADEFWVRGHMPGYPLLPGVLMCEAAAQLCVYYMQDRRSAARRLHRLRRHGERALPRPGATRRPPGPGRPREFAAPPADGLQRPGLRRRDHGLPRRHHRRAHAVRPARPMRQEG